MQSACHVGACERGLVRQLCPCGSDGSVPIILRSSDGSESSIGRLDAKHAVCRPRCLPNCAVCRPRCLPAALLIAVAIAVAIRGLEES